MASLRAFERELKVATAGLQPAAISKLLAQTARQALAAAQSSGEAPKGFIRYVNGREGAAEESVTPPGPIVYVFSWLNEIAEYALAFAEARSPVLSGRYKSSWFAMVNGRLWAPGADIIPPDAQLIVTNDQPYHRKIDTGHMKMRVPPGIVEDTRQAVMRRFGNVVQVERQFISLAGGYALLGKAPRKHAAQNRRSSAFRGGRTHLRSRADTAAGRALTYPALIVSQRF